VAMHVNAIMAGNSTSVNLGRENRVDSGLLAGTAAMVSNGPSYSWTHFRFKNNENRHR
jgi:hypothetical protein